MTEPQQSSSKRANPETKDTLAAFRKEINTIATRAVSEEECREALLDCAARTLPVVGGAWLRQNGQLWAITNQRLPGPLFDRDDLQKWIGLQAGLAGQQHRDIIAASALVKNMICWFIPVETDQIVNSDSKTSHSNPQPVLMLVAASGDPSQSANGILLAAHCIVRAFQSWKLRQVCNSAAQQLKTTSALLELANSISAADSLTNAVQVASNSIQQVFDCRIVTIGLKESTSNRLRLKSISGLGDFDPQSTLAQQIESALTESILHDSVTCYPPINVTDGVQSVAHRRVTEMIGAEATVSVPLMNAQEEVVGAMLLCGSGQKLLPNEARIRLQACSMPVGSSIQAAIRQEGGFISRTARRTVQSVAGMKGIIAFIMMSVAIATLFFPMTYRVSCRCRLEPVSRQYCVAPYDGMVEQTFFRPGDLIEQGALVAQMDGREINWDLAGITAEYARANKELDVHLADQKVADAIQAELEARQLKTREHLLDYRRKNMEIRSPTAGLVLSGSVDLRSNYPVQVGDLLYEVAPLERVRIQLAVPAEEIPHVETNQHVEIQIRGESDLQLSGNILRIRPQSESRYQQNVFIAEVEVDNPDQRLRPGMEGEARINTGTRQLGWIIGHRAWDRAAMLLWW